MQKTAVWKSIAQTLQSEIAGGHYVPGDKLPTEAILASRFSVNRHTVRRAISDLVDQGLVHTRRGSGAFVAAVPTDYPLGQRVRFHHNITAAGRTPTRQVLALEQRLANQREAEALQIDAGAPVQVYEGISFADQAPIALARSVFPAERLPNMLDLLRAEPSITRALAAEGVQDYTRQTTRLTAKRASPTQALHLAIPDGAPILRSVSINVSTQGIPVEYGHTWFAGDRVTLTLSSNDP